MCVRRYMGVAWRVVGVPPPRSAVSKGRQWCGTMNILNKTTDFLLSTNFNLLKHKRENQLIMVII